MSFVVDTKNALKIGATVQEHGRVEFNVPLPSGCRITIFIVQDDELSDRDLCEAANSSLDFWDNPLDDADWNNA